MLFHSFEFIILFLALLQIFWRINPGYRKHLLLGASVFFYGFWSIPFLLHFLAVIAVNYLIIRELIKNKSRSLLIAALSLDFFNLFLFKYTSSVSGFVHENFGFAWAGSIHEFWNIALPLAISFYTFQIVAYVVDVWRGEIKETSFLDFSLFILFFPQLIAGPIMRHRDFMPQLDCPVFSREMVLHGIMLFLLGVFKKVLIADEVSLLIDPVWKEPQHYNALSILAAMFGFSITVYADFSGYTDMARGLASMMGYKIPENFVHPYLSASFTELWKRWHITLSTWLRDYLYIPLGGNRTSQGRFAVNILIVMVLGGIWHGNTLNFFFWGLLHGIFLAIERFTGLGKIPVTKYNYIPRVLMVQTGWLIGSIFFRSGSTETTYSAFSGLVFNNGVKTMDGLPHVFELFLVGMLVQILQKYLHKYIHIVKKYEYALIPGAAIVLFFMIARIEKATEQFIYFQF